MDRQRALDLSAGLSLTPAHLDRVGREVGPELARWAFGQWELRRRARVKFADADRMYFVREALEQATHERVAAYHAAQFPEGTAVADLTTGIGGDLVALARRGPAVGFELDPERAELAVHNLTALGLTAEVRVADALEGFPGLGFEYAFADPARRTEGRRTLDLTEFAPDPFRVAALMADLRLGVIKLSPMLRDEDLAALGVGVEFVSFDGECREALVLTGRDARSGVAAVHVASGQRLAERPAFDVVEWPDAYLFDADPAAVRAHTLGHFGLPILGDSRGFLTGPEPQFSPWLRTYRVLYHGKADPKATRAALRQLNAATPEIKQRGAGLVVEQERKRYASDGARPVSLVVWTQGKSLRHAIVERIESP